MKWHQDRYIAAFRFAAGAHQDQFVPGTRIQYIYHLGLVAMEVIASLGAESGRDEDLAVTVALLHDTLEDTRVTREELEASFGRPVADGVGALTKKEAPGGRTKMADSLARIREQPREIWMVKMADRITNLAPPPPHWEPDKIQSYHREAILIYESLREGSSFLAGRLKDKIDAYRGYC